MSFHYVFRQWLIFFYFYCICGWIFESTYVSLKKRKLTNRGFMKGPWLPLYGSGAVIILFCTLPFQEWPVAVYFVGAAAATILEYITGVAMVRLFKVRYWDYSTQKFQFQGHICLSSSIAWGGLSVLMVYVIHKPVERLIFKIPGEALSVITFIITVCMVYDFANAFRDAMDLRTLLIQAEELKKQIADALEESIAKLEESVEESRARREETLAETKAMIEESKARFEESKAKNTAELERRLAALRERMEKPSRRLLTQNPGSGFVGLKEETEELRKKLHMHKK